MRKITIRWKIFGLRFLELAMHTLVEQVKRKLASTYWSRICHYNLHKRCLQSQTCFRGSKFDRSDRFAESHLKKNQVMGGNFFQNFT